MKNILLSVVVVAVLISAGVGGTLAGFVDTEVSADNFVQAGICDLLINGENEPNIPAKISIQWIQPCKSYDFFIDVEYYGESTHNGDLYMKYKNVVSAEAGAKNGLVWNGVAYVPGTPDGAGVATSEPELQAEEGGGTIAQIPVNDYPLGLQGVDYASGVSDHLDILTWVYDPDGNGILDDPTGNPNWKDPANWKPIASLSNKLFIIEDAKDYMGKLVPQVPTVVWVRVHLQQIECPGWPDDQTKYWPTNALQGDTAQWDMEFELIADP